MPTKVVPDLTYEIVTGREGGIVNDDHFDNRVPLRREALNRY